MSDVWARVLAVLGLAALLLPAPAWADAGGQAQLYVASARVTPQNSGWTISTILRDLDSGAPEPGFAVEVLGTSPSGGAFGPLGLNDPDGDGRYDAALPSVAAGNWALTVRASELPGGQSALPLKRTWTVALQPGQAVDIAGDGREGSRKGAGVCHVGDVLFRAALPELYAANIRDIGGFARSPSLTSSV